MGIIRLPDNMYNSLTYFNSNGKNYATDIEIDVSDVACKIEPNTVINSNGTYELQNIDQDPDLEIQKRNINPNLRVVKREDNNMEMEGDIVKKDSQPTNFGTFTVAVDWPYLVTDQLNYPITQNGNNQVIPIPRGFDYLEHVSVDVNVPQPTTEQITRNITTNNSTTTITPTSGKLIDEVTVNVAVPEPEIGTIANYPITQNGTGQTIPIPTGKDAVNSITVDVAVPSSPSVSIINKIETNAFESDSNRLNILLNGNEIHKGTNIRIGEYMGKIVYKGYLMYLIINFNNDHIINANDCINNDISDQVWNMDIENDTYYSDDFEVSSFVGGFELSSDVDYPISITLYDINNKIISLTSLAYLNKIYDDPNSYSGDFMYLKIDINPANHIPLQFNTPE